MAEQPFPESRVDFERWPYPAVAAHRGAGKLAPENTLAAMRVGASLGHTMFEFDVKLSGDGKPVLLHDATLDRTTSGRGPAGALAHAELKASWAVINLQSGCQLGRASSWRGRLSMESLNVGVPAGEKCVKKRGQKGFD